MTGPWERRNEVALPSSLLGLQAEGEEEELAEGMVEGVVEGVQGSGAASLNL